MKTILSILSIAIFAAFLYSGNGKQPIEESYRQKRIDALTRIKNEMKISNINVNQLELGII